MGGTWKAAWRELGLFALLAGLPAAAIAAVYHLHPWPTPMRQQAANFEWAYTLGYLAVGGLGVFLLVWSKTARAPKLADLRRWERVGLWSLAIGALYGVSDMAISYLTPWGAHLAAIDRRNGYDVSFVNVRPPWSVLHYFHASILSECAFRLAAILIPAWLVGRLLRGRFEAGAYWAFAVLASLIEPIEKAVLIRKWAVFGDTPTEQLLNAEAIAWQFVYAVLLRRWGWPAPILARFGYYLIARCFHQ